MLTAALALGQGLYGIYNTIKANKEAKDYQNQMESQARKNPLMTESPELANYYRQLLNRSNENPYQSQQYQVGAMNIRRGVAQGLNALNDRKAAGDVSKLFLGQQSALQNLGGQAEIRKDARFGQLGGAVQMRKAERDQMFDINQMTPYNRLLQLQQFKTQAAYDRFNAGLSNAAQGASNLAQLNIADKMYNSKLKTQFENPSGSSPFKEVNLSSSSLPLLNNSYVPKTPALKPRNPFLYGITD